MTTTPSPRPVSRADNPFERSLVEPGGPRTFAVSGAVAIFGLAALGHAIAQDTLVRALAGSGDYRAVVMSANLASSVAPVLALAAAALLGLRRAIVGLLALTILGLLWQLSSPGPLSAALTVVGQRGLEVPLSVLLGRALLATPERRDAWFAGVMVLFNVTSGLGSFTRSAGLSVPAAFGAAATLLGLALVVALLAAHEPPAAPVSPSRAPARLIPIAIVLGGATNSIGARLRPGEAPTVLAVASGVAIGIALLATALYALRARRTRDAVAGKLVLAGGLGVVALIGVPLGASTMAVAVAWSVSEQLMTPLVLGLAATTPRTRVALAVVAAVLFAREILTGAVTAVVARGAGMPAMGVAAVVGGGAWVALVVVWWRGRGRRAG